MRTSGWPAAMRCRAGALVVLGVLASASPALAGTCRVGQRVLAYADKQKATVIVADGPAGSSCRLHFDGGRPDEWVPVYNLVDAGAPARDRAAAAAGVRPGRYTITVGRGFYDGYLMLRGGSYELFLPGGRSAGSGRYAFDAAGPRVRWLSGPLTDRRYDGTQAVEGDGAMLKIRIGARSVATNSSR